MTATRVTALLVNCAAAIGWGLYLVTGDGGPAWTVLVLTILLVLPSSANVAALVVTTRRVGSITEMVVASLIIADGLGFVLWIPALLLLGLVHTSAHAGAGCIGQIVLGLLSAFGLAMGARILLQSRTSEHAV
jgi:hypothetical protein